MEARRCRGLKATPTVGGRSATRRRPRLRRRAYQTPATSAGASRSDAAMVDVEFTPRTVLRDTGAGASSGAEMSDAVPYGSPPPTARPDQSRVRLTVERLVALLTRSERM